MIYESGWRYTRCGGLDCLPRVGIQTLRKSPPSAVPDECAWATPAERSMSATHGQPEPDCRSPNAGRLAARQSLHLHLLLETTPVPVLTPDVRATAHGTAGFRATKFGRCSNRSLIRRSDITGLSSGQDLASGAWSSVGPAGPTPATQTATESDAAHSGVS